MIKINKYSYLTVGIILLGLSGLLYFILKIVKPKLAKNITKVDKRQNLEYNNESIKEKEENENG